MKESINQYGGVVQVKWARCQYFTSFTSVSLTVMFIFHMSFWSQFILFSFSTNFTLMVHLRICITNHIILPRVFRNTDPFEDILGVSSLWVLQLNPGQGQYLDRWWHPGSVSLSYTVAHHRRRSQFHEFYPYGCLNFVWIWTYFHMIHTFYHHIVETHGKLPWGKVFKSPLYRKENLPLSSLRITFAHQLKFNRHMEV